MSRQIFRFPVQTSAMNKFLSVLAEGDKEWTVTITRYFKKRSLSQNAMLWGVVYPQILAFWGTDIDDKDMHYEMRVMFLPLRKSPFSEEPRPISSTRLTTAEFAKFIEDICRFWAQEHGLHIETGGIMA